jgi:hypothetical protein
MFYELILAAARSRDIAALTKILESPTIDVGKTGQIYYEALIQLEQEKSNAIDFLLEQRAYRNYAALGAALCGDHAYCEKLIARGASLDYVAWGVGLRGDYEYCDELIARGVNINSILLSSAQGGHYAYCHKLMERGASLRYAVEGAALGGHYVYCEELIAGSVGLDRDYAALLNYALLGAARGGRRAYCDKLMKRGAKREYAVQGAAQSGRYVYCNELVGQALRADVGQLRDGARSILTSAIRGAAQGGYYKYCDQLIEWGVARVYGGMWLKNAALMGAALSGDHGYCDTLIAQQTVQPEDAVRGAALRDDYAHLETLITKENVEYYLYIVSREVIKNDIFKTKAAVFYYLVHFENFSLRNRFIRELYGTQLSKEIKDYLPKAQKQIQEIFYLKDKYDLSIHQAMVMWENRGTLSLWVLQVMPHLLHSDAKSKRPALNVDVLLHITRYRFPALQIKSFEDLSFKVIRYFLTSSIDHYVSPISISSRLSNWLSSEQTPTRLYLARAQSFQKESQLVESKKELARLCIAQSALFNKNNLIDEEGCTTLFYAVANGITPPIVVQELLDNGAAPNIARKSDGETPLNLAVRQGNVKMVALLIGYGANPEQRNKQNETAYDIAKQLDHDVAEEIVRILGCSKPRPILPAHKENVNGWEANDPFVEILEHTCARLVM